MDAQVSATNRSKITNGTRQHVRPKFGGPDMRTRSGRRWRDLLAGFSADLGHTPSAVESAQLRQAATLALRSEELEARAASGARIDAEELTGLCGELRRVLRTLGLGGGPSEPVRTLSELMGER